MARNYKGHRHYGLWAIVNKNGGIYEWTIRIRRNESIKDYMAFIHSYCGRENNTWRQEKRDGIQCVPIEAEIQVKYPEHIEENKS